ncbi:nuclear transport factor 2 family protein [Nocardia sp. NBC_00416]|uniref:nuclear transport factor 2 family protein n=1 Tax=Nocardia sp. NBC_00416 TaxID=2975991 RepID=UPI002E24B294
MNVDNNNARGDTVAAEIADRERARTAALTAGRIDELPAFYDDRLIYTHSNGWRDDKQTLLARSTVGGLRYEQIEHRIEQVQLGGDIAVAIGTMHATVTVGVHTHGIASLTSTIWSRSTAGQPWVMLLFHATPRHTENLDDDVEPRPEPR